MVVFGYVEFKLAVFSQSEVAIFSKMEMLELDHFMMLQDFLSSS